MKKTNEIRRKAIMRGAGYVLVGGSNYDHTEDNDQWFDGLWSIDYEDGRAHLSDDNVDWLRQSGQTVDEYDYDIEEYLTECGCKDIKQKDDYEYSFKPLE